MCERRDRGVGVLRGYGVPQARLRRVRRRRPLPVGRALSAIRRHLPFLGAAGVCLIIGLWAGLARSGWELPLPREHHPLAHGPLLVCAFLDTLISLEKAAAIARGWAYLAPARSTAR